MIQGFRKLFQSRIGLALVLAFVGLVAIAFASADMTGFGFGGVAGGERVATVGDQKVTTADLRQTVSSAYDSARQQNPGLTLEEFLDSGAMDEVLAQMVDRAALFDFGQEAGLRVGAPLVGSELAQIPAFRGPDGNFSEQIYRQTLAQQGLGDKSLRADIASGLVARMVLGGATFGADTPALFGQRYAALLNETRTGAIALLPSLAFAGDGEIGDATLRQFLAQNRERYLLPERRTIRYAIVGAEAVADIEASDAEIEARYRENAAQYRGAEQRRLTQLVLPTQAAAQAVIDRVRAGTSLAAAARDAGLSTAQLAPASRAALASSTSPAVAQAAYEAARGGLAGPVRGPLGWYVLRVDSVSRTQDRGLASVRGELAQEITAQKRQQALADRAAEAEEQLADGAGLAEVARALGASVATSGAVTAQGEPFGGGEALAPIVARVVPAVFAMEPSSDPQIAAGPDGERYIVYAPGKISASAPPEFAELRERLLTDYRRQQGQKAARAAADRVLKAVAGGATLAEALQALEENVPPPETITITRQQLLASQQGVAPPLALMFSMAAGSQKMLEAPQDAGWLIVSLKEIKAPALDADDPLIAQTRQELGGLRSEEYARQLRTAIRQQTEVSRNDKAILAVRNQLTGQR